MVVAVVVALQCYKQEEDHVHPCKSQHEGLCRCAELEVRVVLAFAVLQYDKQVEDHVHPCLKNG